MTSIVCIGNLDEDCPKYLCKSSGTTMTVPNCSTMVQEDVLSVKNQIQSDRNVSVNLPQGNVFCG